ncbi:MAG: hypothetical protein ACREKK_13900 [Candidatus Methylomirabilales bacterium]
MGGSDFIISVPHAMDFRADIEQRLHDLLERGATPSLSRLRSLCRVLGSTLSSQRTRDAVRCILRRVRGEPSSSAPAGGGQGAGADLSQRIRSACGDSAIERYPDYLFTVEQAW